MDSEDPESPDLSPPSTQTNPDQEPHLRLFAAADEPLAADPSALVQRLIEEGEWPEPVLLEQILSAGDASVQPLIDFVQTRPRGSPARTSLEHAIGLLSMLRPSSAIRELIEIIKFYKNDTARAAIDALVDFGAPGFDALLELCTDPSVRGYMQVFVIEGAAYAASDDPDRRSRLAQVLRPILEKLIASAREELRLNGFLAKDPPDGEIGDDDEEFDELDDWDNGPIDEEPFDDKVDLEAEPCDESLVAHVDDSDLDDSDLDDSDLDDSDLDDSDLDDSDDEYDIEPYVAEGLGYIVDVLADLADPEALEPIRTAFREGLVDESIIDLAQVEEYYDPEAPKESAPAVDWLTSYRDYYAEHLDELNQPLEPFPTYVPRPKYAYQDRYEEPEPPPGIPVTAPIRNDRPKLGRNDPCWCGSGKKYKKCHLGKEPAP